MNFHAWGSADHIISKAEFNQGFDGSSDVVLVRGGCDFRHFVPALDKSGPLARDALVEMYGPENPERFRTDGSGELQWACDELGFRSHGTSPIGD